MKPQTQAELNYQAARLTVQRMLEQGIISEAAAERLKEKFYKRYQPLIGGFLHDTDEHKPIPLQEEKK